MSDGVHNLLETQPAEAARMRQERDVYGDPCGNSRWFNSIPKVEPNAPPRKCDEEMEYTGIDWPSSTPGHQ